MISDYMGDLIIDKIDFGRTPYNKHIYKNYGGKYIITKSIKGKNENYGTYSTLEEARKVRDLLAANEWDKSIIQDQLDEQKREREYFHHIRKSGRYYHITNFQGEYCGLVKKIEEALYYRDLVYELQKEDIIRPYDMDLKTDNPYLENGLDYPVPEKLIIDLPETNYGKGQIIEKGPQSYHVYYGDVYFYACRTFEMAYYVKQELNKCGWDKSKLDEIVEGYPVWYTWLNNLYQYIIPDDGSWLVNLTTTNTGYDCLERIRFRRLEDALWERDLMLKYNWDEELMIECADDNDNPYYDMELPPYPQRKIRRIAEREPRTELFNKLFDLIYNGGYYNMEQYCELCGTNSVTLRNILRNEFDTNWNEFRTLCENGENPNDVLEQKPIIYNPDLSRHYDNNGHIAQYNRLHSKYVVSKWFDGRNYYYGAYPTRELAEKIVKDLVKCNWDKSKLKDIQAKHGHQSLVNSKRWVYPMMYKSKKTGEKKVAGYSIRKKESGTKKIINYGFYKDKRVAELIRDLLVKYDWDKSRLDDFKDYAAWCISEVDRYENYKSY